MQARELTGTRAVHGPALTIDNGRLCMAWTDLDNHIQAQSAVLDVGRWEQAGWDGPHLVRYNRPAISTDGPGMTSYPAGGVPGADGHLWLTFRTEEGAVVVAYHQSSALLGLPWDFVTIPGVGSSDGPSIASIQGVTRGHVPNAVVHLVLTWKGLAADEWVWWIGTVDPPVSPGDVGPITSPLATSGRFGAQQPLPQAGTHAGPTLAASEHIGLINGWIGAGSDHTLWWRITDNIQKIQTVLSNWGDQHQLRSAKNVVPQSDFAPAVAIDDPKRRAVAVWKDRGATTVSYAFLDFSSGVPEVCSEPQRLAGIDTDARPAIVKHDGAWFLAAKKAGSDSLLWGRAPELE
jgi:hypothetical protein